MQNEVFNEIELNNDLVQKQENFLDSFIGKTINTAIDVGIRAALPDFLEEQIINVKNNIFRYGLKDGVKKTISDAVELGKSAIGLVKGEFNNIEEMRNVVKEGGIIDGVSDLWDYAVDKVYDKGKISKGIAKSLKNVKQTILNNVESNIEKNFNKQKEKTEILEKEINEWEKAFDEKDIKKLDKAYEKIESQLKSIAPLEKNIKKAREIENIYELIKNNENDFNIDSEKLQLAHTI